MIHSLLLRLSERLPFYPPAVVFIGAVLVIALALWLLGRSRQTVLFSAAVGILGLGLAVGLFGLDHPGSPASWKAVEELAERFIGPASFRRYEQFTAAGLVLAAALLARVYHLATRELPGERARRLLEQDHVQSSALGSAHLCAPQKRPCRLQPQGSGLLQRRKVRGAQRWALPSALLWTWSCFNSRLARSPGNSRVARL